MVLTTPTRQRLQAFTPGWFRLFPLRSPLLRESLLISFPQGTKMFQFPCLPSTAYGFSCRYHGITHGGLPHSEILGSMPACGSPRRIGACPVLHRPKAPRHPPYALSSLTFYAVFKVLGGDERARTADPLLAREVLSQLSYIPTKKWWA